MCVLPGGRATQKEKVEIGCRKFLIKLLKENNLGVVRALFNPESKDTTQNEATRFPAAVSENKSSLVDRTLWGWGIPSILVGKMKH